MSAISVSKKAPFSKSSTEFPSTITACVRPASEGRSSVSGALLLICRRGSRWRLIDQMTIPRNSTTQASRTSSKVGLAYRVGDEAAAIVGCLTRDVSGPLGGGQRERETQKPLGANAAAAEEVDDREQDDRAEERDDQRADAEVAAVDRAGVEERREQQS